MGLGLYAPTLVGWDSTAVEVPLTDTLWDYPRLSWNDFVPTNFVPTAYLVRFTPQGRVVSGSITNDLGKLNVPYGDEDGDGLDVWMETRAHTNVRFRDPDPAADPTATTGTNDVTGRLQYDWVDTGKVLDPDGKLTFGELLDDTDGMPAQWELAYGLDPHLFDGDSDLDDDGWSNYAEFLADSDPSDPDDYPRPQFDVTFRYDGEAIGADTLKVMTYSERRQGTHLVETDPDTIYMGGLYDGLYTTHARSFGNFADAGEGEIEGVDFGISSSGGEHVGSAVLTVTANVAAETEGENALSAQTSYALQPYNDEFGVFVNDGNAFILLEYETGLVYSRFSYVETTTSSNVTTSVIKTRLDSSPLYTSRYVIEYSSSTTHYPFTVRGLQAADLTGSAGTGPVLDTPADGQEAAGSAVYPSHDHMVEGYNRFLGWMDLNDDNTWNPGEPMGLSLYDATLVGWNSVVTEIPLTDELFGFPRIAWEAPTNMLGVTSYHVYITRPVGDGDDEDEEIEENAGPEDGIVVEAPRTFLHEGDYVAAGIKGLDLGDAANALYRYEVIAQNDSDMSMQQVIAEGEFRLLSREVNPADGVRRAMSAVYPTNNAVLHGPLVELRWKMDWRTEGVYVTVRKDGAAIPELTDLYVPFPVRHGRITDDDYYYSYIPQLKDGRSIVSLGPGNYTWEVEENLNLAGYEPKKASGTFSIVNGGDTTRSVASIKGNVHYYGRLANESGVFSAGKVVILAYRASDQASSSLGVSGNPVARLTLNGAGPFTVPNLEPGSYGLIGFVDANGNGLPDVEETQGTAFLGGTADPVQLSEWFGPIRIAAKDGAAVPVEDVHVVLRDRDLNGDKVPDAYAGTLAAYKNLTPVTVPAAKPTTGPGTNWVSTAVFDPGFRPYTSRDNKKITSTTDPSTVPPPKPILVKAPRTFLHEGDLAKNGLYGFDLGKANAVDYTWEVVATDGANYQTNAGGTFFIFAGGKDRLAPEPRWPVQNTVVHGSTVRFEWTMDDRNAGVEFSLWRLSGPETNATKTVVFDKLVVPFPVRHWDTEVECFYYTAVPQMENGLKFVDLPDGFYEYTITERPRTTFEEVTVRSTRTERFQIRNDANTLVTGSIEGDVRYYGRSMTGDHPDAKWVDGNGDPILHVQAYKVSDTARSSASVGGQLVAETVQDANGAFRIGGLAAGTYSVFAFVDSNTNGIADAWETQGFGVFGGNASPVVIPATAPAIVVTNGAFVTQVNVVLHDRDTDGDLLPDVWEWREFSSLTAHNGYETSVSNDYATTKLSEGDGVLADWSWRATNVVTRQVDIPQTDGLRVRIDGPREFLHEGDLVTPYILRDRSSGAKDEESNRSYYVWKRVNEVDGTFSWKPLDEPYYGFYLGSYSNAVVNYTVEVWNGMDAADLAKGSFRVAAVVGDGRLPMTPRWPTQMTPVHGSPVRFEWNMDDHNAGVLFSLRNLDTGEQILKDLVVPFPVRHWDPTVKCYYYTAEPQMEAPLRFVDLPAGAYEYTIVERPQTDLVEPAKIVERFQLVKGDPTLTTATLSGDVRYYGRAMEPGDPPTWGSTNLHIQAYEVSDAAMSSASVGGRLVADIAQNTNGAFRIDGLKAGTYTVFAFVDSNTNGVADSWETQGIGVLGGNASPVIVAASAPPIVVTNGAFVTQINVVLHDRDTDGDLLPDAWEWGYAGSLTDANGYDPVASNAYVSLPLSEGETVLTNWSWKATNIITRLIDIPETAGLRVRIDEPRTFLHEGDLLAPYELVNRTSSGADADGNRRYRLWTLETSGLDGMQAWVPLDRPYYGFELGSYTNIEVKWTAEATDGVDTMTLAESAFRVVAASDAEYDHAAARYPVQNQVVRTSVVQFEWLMDDRSAGVDFRLWKEDGPATEGTNLVASMTIPLPVRHWDADERCYYWTARPQQEDGLRFLDLPDGYYRYEIRTRPQTSTLIASPRVISERFQMAKGEPSRVTGSIDGTIRYFGRSMDDGTPPTWPADLHLQARLVGDSAATSASVGGEIVSDEVRSTNGAFRVTGLAAGTYTILAFVDSNGNGIADDWETQGYGVFGGSASPVVVPGSAPPIIVTNGAAVTGVNVVLHDRDTDGDKLPDVWEWKQYGNLTDAWAGHEPGEPYAAADRTASEGEDVLLDWTWPIDWTQVIRRAAATAVKEALRVRVEAPRTFLHEGDFLAPYILRDRSPDATDEPANRFYRLWLGQEIGGVRTWIPQTEPYLGFDLGSHSNIVVTWTVETSDGSGTTEIASGTFPVSTVTGEPRMPASARYPIQNTTVRTAIVEFEWTMDEHNAGVVFSLWKTDGPNDEEGVPIATNRIVALPVRHWDAVKRCFYWTARPQLGDGIEVLDLEDGWYRYEITTCPRTDLVDTETISGRFRMAKTEGSRVTGSIDGTIRYFGRSMDASADPATWGDAVLHLQARKVGESATSSAMVGGALVADQTRGTNGAFRIDGLAAGTYTILAFVDSNGNGIADDWETQGYGVFGGSASPVVVPGSAPPIVVTNGAAVTGVNVVLHDRDTDGDRLPDVWEWSRFGNLATSGYDINDEVIPNGLRLLDYVESTGAQWVDTGVFAGPQTRSETDVAVMEWGDGVLLSGSGSNRHAFGKGWSGSITNGGNAAKLYFGLGAQNYASAVKLAPLTGVRHVYWIDAAMAKAGLDGREFSLDSAGDIGTNLFPAALLAQRTGAAETSVRGKMTARLYGCKYYEAGTLVRDFVPVLDANGVAGLLDRVSGQVFYSATATPFVAGPERVPADGEGMWLWEAYAALPYSDPDALADWIWPIDWTQVLRGAAATAVKEALRVRVEAPRTFLHEGDLLAPYILRDRSPDAKDEPDNRLYRLWRGQEVDGVQTWIPQTEPYLGFNLGSHSNIVVTWTVEASDGSSSAEIATGSFPVRAEIGEARMPVTSRYPVQNEKVRTSVVEFQWTMDECNAGVVFDVWKVSGPEGTKDDADAVQILTNRVVALPVRHWDAAKRCYYWTARPQQADGTEFVPLADGFYVYSIATRPQTDLVAPETIEERFQMRTGEPSPTTASIAGTIRYFGRSMDANSVPPTWPADLHLQAWKVSSKAGSSASAGGIVYADEVRSTNGAFRVSGLPAGTYAIVAFVDSNGNGVADDWETQGFGTYGGSASPVVIGTTAYPISVTNGQELSGIHVILHDRDTDNDLLPDVWEWAYTNSLTDVNGYMEAVSNAYVALTNSEPDSLSDWTWPTPADVGTPIVQDETESVRVRVDGPRTFLHEGDFMMPYVYGTRLSGLRALGYYAANGMPAWSDLVTNGVNDASFLVDDRNRVPYLWRKRKDDSPWEALSVPYYGFWLGSSSNVVVKWTVEAWDGADTTNVADGSFHVISTTGAQRKRLAARYPTQQTEIFGNVVEFEWEMDDHNAGVYFTLRKIAGEGVAPGAPVTVISNMVVAIPIRHGRDGIDGSYYSAVPQLDGGALYAGKIEGEPDFDRAKWSWTPDNGKTFIALPGDGLYEYTITERPQSDSVAPQTIVERFQLVNSGETRGLYDVSGSIRYYGKVMESEPVDGVDFAPNGDRTVWTATAPADVVVPGAMSVLVKDGEDVVEAFSDSQANGILYASGGTNSTAWSGTIDYESGAIEVRFSRALADGRTPTLAVKSFPAPLFLQAFRLPDEATTCVSVSGTPVYQEVRRAKGDFMVRNLEAGRYAIRAFLDSNGNGYCDEWETQGLAVQTGTVSPNLDPNAAPIVVADNVTGLMIVLHDRDTDNDLLPDAWEWWKAGGSLLTSGYESDEGGLEWWRQYADGVLDSDPRTPDTDLDGLTDAMEILVTQTDTHLRDTDGDGIGDLEEFLSGSDPLKASEAIPYTVPSIAFDGDGVPFVEVSYPALRPGVTLTYELQRKESLAGDAWTTVGELPVANDGGAVFYSQYDGVNAHLSDPGTGVLRPEDQLGPDAIDLSTGFYRIKVFADYGKMVENADGTCSFWTWVRTGPNAFEYREAARGKGKLVRDANGNWSFVSDATGRKGVLVRGEDGTWSFQE